MSAKTLLMILGALVAAGGCESRNPLLAPVHGRVTMDDKPVKEVAVTFTPIGDTQGNGSIGGTDADGRFTLIDVRGEAGAYAGEYRVSLYPTPAAGKIGDPESVVSSPSAFLPATFINPNNTPLRATIPPGGGAVEILLTRSGEGATTKTTPLSKE